jgi:hypothetical protein
VRDERKRLCALGAFRSPKLQQVNGRAIRGCRRKLGGGENLPKIFADAAKPGTR